MNKYNIVPFSFYICFTSFSNIILFLSAGKKIFFQIHFKPPSEKSQIELFSPSNTPYYKVKTEVREFRTFKMSTIICN